MIDTVFGWRTHDYGEGWQSPVWEWTITCQNRKTYQSTHEADARSMFEAFKTDIAAGLRVAFYRGDTRPFGYPLRLWHLDTVVEEIN